MFGPVSHRIRLAAASVAVTTLAGAVSSLLSVPAVRAADELPFPLPRGTTAAVVADLDGDGARELIRIAEAAVERPDPALDMVVEAWRLEPAGWRLAGSAPLLRPSLEGSGFESVDAISDAFGLLAWHDGERERALVVSASGPDPRNGSGIVCCLVLHDVVIGGGGLSLWQLEGFGGDAEAVTRLDMEADGTDELLVSEAPGGDGVHHVTVLRWRAAGFEAERFEIGASDVYSVPIVGETDGNPGDEAIFGPMEDGSLARLIDSGDGALAVESAEWAGDREPEGMPWMVGAGGGLFFTQFPGTVTAWKWAPGEEPSRVSQAAVEESSSIGVLTAGDVVAVVETEWGIPNGGLGPAVTRVHRAGAPPLEFAPTRGADDIMQLNRRESESLMRFAFGVYPQVGPIPGGLADGSSAYASMGNLVTLASSGELDVRPAGAMAGGYTVGLAGEGGSWMAMSRGYVGTGPTAYLYTVGGFVGSTVTLVPSADVLEVEGEGTVQMTPSASVAGLWPEDGTERVFVPEGGLQVTVTGPVGSTVVGIIGRSMVHDVTLAGEPTVVTLTPVTRRDSNETYDGLVLVLTAGGQLYLERWNLVILREPPALSVAGDTHVGELTASVGGRASTHATVLVDGVPVALDEEGRFEVRVDAPPWPRDIVVVARDAVGNETPALVSVVGLIDYRGLPWVALVAAVTLLAGVRLFVRTPGRPREPIGLEDGVLLEELDSHR